MGLEQICIAFHVLIENWSITHNQVPSSCLRATLAVTVPSGKTVEVRARSPLIKASL